MLIRYESGQSGRYVFRGHEFLWDTKEDGLRVIARGPQDQEAIRDEEFCEDLIDSLLDELDAEEFNL